MRIEEDGFWIECLDLEDPKRVRVGFLKETLSSTEKIEKVGAWVKEASAVKKGDPLFILESEKVGFDIDAVGSGLLSKINSAVLENPDLLRKDPEGEGWLYEMELSEQSQQELIQKYPVDR